MRIINGYDSFGNTCGTKYNKKMGNLEWSGLDTSGKPYLLFFDIKELKHSLKICVKQCPNITLSKTEDIYKYYKDTGNNLCKYGFDYSSFLSTNLDKKAFSSSFGPCPVVPVYERLLIFRKKYFGYFIFYLLQFTCIEQMCSKTS